VTHYDANRASDPSKFYMRDDESSSTVSSSASSSSEVPSTIADLLDDYLENIDTQAPELECILDEVYELTSQHAFWDEAEGHKKLAQLLQKKYPL